MISLPSFVFFACCCVFLQGSVCDVVYLSSLSSQEAHTQSRVNLTALIPSESPDRVSYSGYISVDPTLTNGFDINYFFWFFESNNKTESSKDIPILLWLQGGPGCTSLEGLFVENGPYIIVQNTSYPITEQLGINPNAWTNEFHMIFVDNPVGSGFSYGPILGYTRNGTVISAYLENVLAQFFTLFPEYQPNPFYAFGESFAGHYIPSLCSYIQKKQPPSIINLRGMGIGDGYTDPFHQVSAHADMCYNTGLADEAQAEEMRKLQRITQEFILEEKWEAALTARLNVLNYIETVSGNVNLYDYRTYVPYSFTYILDYVNQDYVRQILHVGNHTIDQVCSSIVADFLVSYNMQSVADLIPDLLDQYPSLYYQGQFDARDGVVSVETMLKHLYWSGIPNYLRAPRYVWTVDGVVGGMTRYAGNLYQCVVVGAGHLVPMNQGAASLEMVRRFVYNLSWDESQDK